MAVQAKATGTKVITGEVRISFPHVFKPSAIQEGQKPKYSVMLLIPKTDKATIEAIRSAQKQALENGKAKFNGKVPASWKDTLRDGDTERDTEDYPEYAGHYFMNASATEDYPPHVVDRQVQPILDQSEIYSGCYCRASINAFAFATQGNKGVSFGLNNLQKLRDGEPLSGAVSRAEDDFESLDSDEGDDLI